MIVAEDVLKVICDKESLELFRIVALTRRDSNSNSNSSNTDDLVNKTKLTGEQYYSRISTLSNAGLVKSNNGKYALTAFGKVVYDIIQIKLQNAVNNYWKLKAIDSLEDSGALPVEEHKKLIDKLIDNQEIKAILVPDKDNNNNNNNNNNNKKLADQPLLNIEQQKALKQTHEENKKCKGEKYQREQQQTKSSENGFEH
jgi:hypothetical protein